MSPLGSSVSLLKESSVGERLQGVDIKTARQNCRVRIDVLRQENFQHCRDYFRRSIGPARREIPKARARVKMSDDPRKTFSLVLGFVFGCLFLLFLSVVEHELISQTLLFAASFLVLEFQGRVKIVVEKCERVLVYAVCEMRGNE